MVERGLLLGRVLSLEMAKTEEKVEDMIERQIFLA